MVSAAATPQPQPRPHPRQHPGPVGPQIHFLFRFGPADPLFQAPASHGTPRLPASKDSRPRAVPQRNAPTIWGRCWKRIPDIADAKYDIINNYIYLRDKNAIPILDYNRRNEDLSKPTLLNRGYNENGYPFAPCGLLTRPNGFDKRNQRLTFCCFKQCDNLRPVAKKKLQLIWFFSIFKHRNNMFTTLI